MSLQGHKPPLTVSFDPYFDVACPATQQSLVDLCDKLILANAVVVDAAHGFAPVCFGHALRDTAMQLNRSFPITEFAYETVWETVRKFPQIRYNTGFLGGRIFLIRDTFELWLTKDSTAEEAMASYKAFKHILYNSTRNESFGNNSVSVSSSVWMRAETQIGLQSGIADSMLTSMFFALTSMLFFTGSVAVTALSVLSISFIIIIVMSCIQLLGWELGIVEIVGLCLLIGTTVDYLLHLGHAYSHCTSSSHTRLAKARKATGLVGGGIVGAALTTVASMTPLLFCQTVPLFKFGIFLSIACAVSMVYSLMFFTVTLSIAGPETSATPRECCAGHCGCCSVDQVAIDHMPDSPLNQVQTQGTADTVDIYFYTVVQGYKAMPKSGRIVCRFVLVPTLVIVSAIIMLPSILPVPLCNGSADLCTKAYSNVTFVAARHPVGLVEVPCTVDTTCVEENWVAQNQWQDFPLSMNMGVRAFVFSLGVFEDQPHVCHGDCKWGRRPLKVVFQQLYSFLTSNLREVITLVLDNNPAHGVVLQAEIEGLVVQAGLGSFINVSVLDSFGTGLGTLIEEKARLVIFADFKEDSVNILSSQRYVSAVPLDCAASGAVSPDAPFVLVRQYADDAARLGSSPHVSAVLATKPRIQACQQACAERLGRRPNFLVNDFVTAEGLMMGRSTASTAIRSCVSNAVQGCHGNCSM
jgi:hypothetical protein